MKKLFEKDFTRRNFLKTSAKILAGTALFGLLPNEADAARRFFTLGDNVFKTLEEMEIMSYPLDFDEMNYRTHTGAIVIHHTGMRFDGDMSVPEIHNMHRYKNHWAGIGYHFVVHKNGSIEQGRPLEARGAHSLDNNEFTVGICLTGNYNLGKPPAKQVSSAVQLIGAVCDKYNFEATDTTIFGHRDLSKTTCPGDHLYKLLPNIIEKVQRLK